jgi:DNA methylase
MPQWTSILIRLKPPYLRLKINCIYIDPPYNTDASAIDYKNGYKASSWMSLINDRLALSKPLMDESGVLITAIDDEQQRELSLLIGDNFAGRILGTVCVRANPSGRPTQTGYSVSHEYLFFAGESERSKSGGCRQPKNKLHGFPKRTRRAYLNGGTCAAKAPIRIVQHAHDFIIPFTLKARRCVSPR